MRLLSVFFCHLFIFLTSFAYADIGFSIIGSWKNTSILCYNESGILTRTVKLVDIPTVDFEADIRITITKSNEVYSIQKSIGETKCTNPDANTATAFVNSQFQMIEHSRDALSTWIKLIPHYQVTSQNIKTQIDTQLINSCFSNKDKILMALLSPYKYPNYFIREANRMYTLRKAGPYLLISFKDKEEDVFCKKDKTVMLLENIN